MSGAMNEKEIEELSKATQVQSAHFVYALVCYCRSCIIYLVELETTRGGTFPAGNL